MKEVSGSAYVFRTFDLVFGVLREPAVIERLTEEERRDLLAFTAAFDRLPWKPLEAHPHISALADDRLDCLVSLARRLDRRLWLRTSSSIVPIIYRFTKGWCIVRQPKLEEEKAPNQ